MKFKYLNDTDKYYARISYENMFKGSGNIYSPSLLEFNTSIVKSIWCMYRGCLYLSSLN